MILKKKRLWREGKKKGGEKYGSREIWRMRINEKWNNKRWYEKKNMKRRKKKGVKIYERKEIWKMRKNEKLNNKGWYENYKIMKQEELKGEVKYKSKKKLITGEKEKSDTEGYEKWKKLNY